MIIDFSELDSYLDSVLEYGFPMYDCIVMQEHKQLYRRQGGFIDIASQRKHVDNTMYYLYSVSKPITAVAALQLVEKGLLDLDGLLSDYIPEFKNVKVCADGHGVIFDSPFPVTIRQVFSFTGGFGFNTDSVYIRSFIKDYPKATTLEIIKNFAQEPLEYIPGEKWRYGLSLDVLAAVVEAVSGKRFEQYVTDNIFIPLGMTHSAYHMHPDFIPRLASVYRFTSEKHIAEFIPYHQNEFIFSDEYDSGGAGIISCAEDYIKFADALASGGISYNGNRILNSETIELMKQNVLNENQLKCFHEFGSHFEPYGYGLGVRTRLHERKSNDFIGPDGEFGWGGALGALVFIDTSRKLSVYYAQHTDNPQEGKIMPELRDTIFNCIEKAEQ